MTPSLENKLKNLINDLKTKRIQTFYCSMAEIAENNFVQSSLMAFSIDKVKNKNYSEGLEQLIDSIKEEQKLSTEVIGLVMIILIEMNEFYYAMFLAKECWMYFDKGDFSKVPALDKPYINDAKNITRKRYIELEKAFDLALNTNDLSLLKTYVLSYGFKTNISNPIFISNSQAISQIKDYFKCANIQTTDTKDNKSLYKSKGLCQYCGGNFHGLFAKKCVNCGKKKDY